jgi:hypothetical protein
MANFQDAVADCGFLDLGFTGLPYTWHNRQVGSNNVKARLDRAFGDHKFLEAVGDISVRHLQTAFTDHAGLLIEIKEMVHERCNVRNKKRAFRYEHMWQRHWDYNDFVAINWEPGVGNGDLLGVAASLSNLQEALSGSRGQTGSSRGTVTRVSSKRRLGLELARTVSRL